MKPAELKEYAIYLIHKCEALGMHQDGRIITELSELKNTGAVAGKFGAHEEEKKEDFLRASYESVKRYAGLKRSNIIIRPL